MNNEQRTVDSGWRMVPRPIIRFSRFARLSRFIIHCSLFTIHYSLFAAVPPWKAHPPLAPATVPPVYLAEWKKADNSATCAPLVLLGAEKEDGIKLRRANFHGGWAVAYDTPTQRSSFGIAGVGMKADGKRSDILDNRLDWSDGSFADYGLEGGVGPGYLAYLTVAGQECFYNVWTKRGKEHLLSLIENLRMVDTPAIVNPNLPSIVRALEKQIPELTAEYHEKSTPEPDHRRLHYSTAGVKATAAENLYLYWYERPKAAHDWILVAYDTEEAPAAAWLKAFAYDRKAKMLTALETPPFKPLPMEAYDKEAEGDGYWRTAYSIDEKGNVTISASPSMAMTNVMVARWNKADGKFTLHKRAAVTSQPEVADDTPEMEDYIKTTLRPNYQRISENKKWTWVEEKEAFDLTLEGAKLTYYYTDRGLEKIVAKLFGESFQEHIEYYFLDNRLSFIHSKTKRYTKHFMDETFDSKKDFTPEERRWYIKDDTAIRALGNEGKPLSATEKKTEYLGDEDNPRSEYSSYLKILKK